MADTHGEGRPPAAKGSPKDGSSDAVLVHRLLNEDLVLTFPDAGEKEPIVRSLAERLTRVRGLPDPEACLRKVLEREAGISTTLDSGLSLPHARLERTTDFSAVLGIVAPGIPDQHQPDITIKAVLLFFSPGAPAYFQRHLQFLRHVATLFQPALIDELVGCSTPREALAALRAKEV